MLHCGQRVFAVKQIKLVILVKHDFEVKFVIAVKRVVAV